MRRECMVADDEFEAAHSDSETMSKTVSPLITTRSTPTMLDLAAFARYVSSEEEISPSLNSSDGQTSFTDLEAEPSKPLLLSLDPMSDVSDDEFGDVCFATSVTLSVVGPPRLVDIVRLAPIQRRKRNRAPGPRPAPLSPSISSNAIFVQANSISTIHSNSTPDPPPVPIDAPTVPSRRPHRRTLSWAKRQEAAHPGKRFGMGFGNLSLGLKRPARGMQDSAQADRGADLLAPKIPRFPFESRSTIDVLLECT